MPEIPVTSMVAALAAPAASASAEAAQSVENAFSLDIVSPSCRMTVAGGNSPLTHSAPSPAGHARTIAALPKIESLNRLIPTGYNLRPLWAAIQLPVRLQ